MKDLKSKTVDELRRGLMNCHLDAIDVCTELARRLEEAEQKIVAIEIEGPHTPCRCVVDGDDGTLAHLCAWHERSLTSHDAEVAAKALDDYEAGEKP